MLNEAFTAEGEEMKKCREDGQKKALKEGERLRGKKGGRQGC